MHWVLIPEFILRAHSIHRRVVFVLCEAVLVQDFLRRVQVVVERLFVGVKVPASVCCELGGWSVPAEACGELNLA